MNAESVRHLSAVPDVAPSTLIVDEGAPELSPVGDGQKVVRPDQIGWPSSLVGLSFVLSALAIVAIVAAATIGELIHPEVAIAALIAVIVIDGLLTAAEIVSIRKARR